MSNGLYDKEAVSEMDSYPELFKYEEFLYQIKYKHNNIVYI